MLDRLTAALHQRDELEEEIKRLQSEIARLRKEVQKERSWREELQQLSLELTIELEKLKGLQ